MPAAPPRHAESPAASPPRRKIQPSPEVREIFTAEADEHGQAIAGHLTELRVGKDRRDHLGALRRRVHNLKGSAALVGLDDLSRVAHGMEDLLDLLDLQGRGPTADELAALTRAGDALHALIYRDGADIDVDRVLDRLTTAVDGGTHQSASPADPAAAPAASPPMPIEAVPEGSPPGSTSALDPVEANHLTGETDVDADADADAETTGDGTARRFVRVPVDALDEAVRLLVEVDAERQQLRALLRDQTGNLGELDRTDRRLRREVRRLETELEVAALDGGPQPTAPNSPFDALELDRYTSLHERSRALIESTGDLETLRVDLGREAISLGQSVDRLDGVTTRLRDRLLGMRLVPLRTLASRLQGVVRLAADRLGKTVRLELDDRRVELDKDVLDALVDPLDHLLRNAVAHGVESPEARDEADKATTAVIRVDARYTPRGVEVRVVDDGAGLDLERLGQRAVERGVWTAEARADATPRQLAELIFEPGLSTAATVDRIAGRGVGMDVVRQRLGELRGRVEVESTRGEGTAVVLELPTSLAVQHVVLVDDGGYRLAVPAIGVERIERIEANRLEPVGEHTVLRSDDRIYRVARLASALGLPSAVAENPQRPVEILMRHGDQDLAVVVDAMAGGRDVVVQDLGRHLRRLPGLLGVTHVGSGHPVPIVDPAAWFGIDAAARPAVQVDTRSDTDAAPVVLVVDDSLSMRRYLGQVVRRFGYRAVEAR
ncbi:MAG: ATP-binding protein, partial [Acidobacteriota bacterium]